MQHNNKKQRRKIKSYAEAVDPAALAERLVAERPVAESLAVEARFVERFAVAAEQLAAPLAVAVRLAAERPVEAAAANSVQHRQAELGVAVVEFAAARLAAVLRTVAEQEPAKQENRE